jgi:hypothetical protein
MYLENFSAIPGGFGNKSVSPLIMVILIARVENR